MEVAKQIRKAARHWVTKVGNKLLAAVDSGAPCLGIEQSGYFIPFFS